MSANFLLSHIEIPAASGDDFVPAVLAAAEAAKARVREPTFDLSGVPDQEDPDEPLTAETVLDAIDRVVEGITAVYSGQITCNWFNGRHYAFVGGMSWGDAASDYSDDFDLLLHLGIDLRGPVDRCSESTKCGPRQKAMNSPEDARDAGFFYGISRNWKFCPWCGEQET